MKFAGAAARLVPTALLLTLTAGCCKPRTIPEAPPAPARQEPVDDASAFAAFYADFEPRLAAASKAATLARWEASTTGAPEAFARSEKATLELDALHSDPKTFALLKRLRSSEAIADPVRRRTLEILYLAFQRQQIPAELNRELVEASTALEKSFNTFRAEVDGKQVTANEIRKVLMESDDSELRRLHWEASKAVGPTLAPRLRALVEKRNQAARSLGYSDYYDMSLRLQEQDPDQIEAIFDAIDKATAGPFEQFKAELDAGLAKRFGIAVGELRPWHYGDVFFQEPPGVEGLDLDPTFAKIDQLDVMNRYFRGIGLDGATRILQRSDLYERAGKVEHAFCEDIDRAGDIRVLANLVPNEEWTGTLMHELGHGLYDAYIRTDLPFVLRKSSHALVTEGVAELFGAMTRDPAWLQAFTPLDPEARARVASLRHQYHRGKALVFARWSLVVMHFERAMYADPSQDLQALWWNLVRRYQKLTPPAAREALADWATKIHLVTVPAYYHNYLLGELFASQLRQRIGEIVPGAKVDGAVRLVDNPAIGKFMIEQIFAPGKLLRWDDLVRRATGAPLSPAAFLAEIRD